MKQKHSQEIKNGFSLVEMLVYVSLITVIFLFIVSTILSFTGSYRQLSANRALEHTAINVLERVTRDIRSATQIDATNSVFGTNPGTLTLIQTTNSISTTTKFYVQSNVVKLDVNGTYLGPLSVTSGGVTSLIFTLLPNANGAQAVKIDMTVQGTSGTVTRTKIFHTTIIAKGS